VKVLKAMGQACDLIRYYITFEAKDVADGGQIKTYKTLLVRCREPPLDVNFSVM
jgi:hypothetical protein